MCISRYLSVAVSLCFSCSKKIHDIWKLGWATKNIMKFLGFFKCLLKRNWWTAVIQLISSLRFNHTKNNTLTKSDKLIIISLSKHLVKQKNYKQLDLHTWWNSTFHWKQTINFEILLMAFVFCKNTILISGNFLKPVNQETLLALLSQKPANDSSLPLIPSRPWHSLLAACALLLSLATYKDLHTYDMGKMQ